MEKKSVGTTRSQCCGYASLWCGSGCGFLFDADADAYPGFQNDGDPCGFGSTTLSVAAIFCLFFGGGRARVCWPLLCLCRPFSIFLRGVWIRTQRAAVASRRATNLAIHLASLCIFYAFFEYCPSIFSSSVGKNSLVFQDLSLLRNLRASRNSLKIWILGKIFVNLQ